MPKRYLFAATFAVLAIAGLVVRMSNAHEARAQADRIVQQDTAGADTSAALAALKNYVKTHSGSSVKLTLKGAYDRAQKAAAEAARASAANSQIYADAQKACSGKSDSITQARCNSDYLAKHLVNVPAPTPIPEPRLSDYQVSYQAPFWTTDLSGALLLGAVAALVLTIITFARRER